MEEYLLPVQNNVVKVKDICDFTFAGPNSVIIPNSFNYTVRVLVELGFLSYFNRTLSPLFYYNFLFYLPYSLSLVYFS